MGASPVEKGEAVTPMVPTTAPTAATLDVDKADPLPLTRLAAGVFVRDETVERRIEGIITDCMASKGFRYVPSIESAPADWVDGYASGQLALDEVAAEHGYPDHAASSLEAGGVNPGLAELEAGARADWELAFFGADRLEVTGTSTTISDGGCLAKGEAAVYPDRARFTALSFDMQSLLALSVSTTMNDPEVLTAIDSWSDCMRTRGFEVASPSEARALAGVGEPSRPMAIAEAQCAEITHLNESAMAVSARVQAALAERYAALIAEWTATLALTKQLASGVGQPTG